VKEMRGEESVRGGEMRSVGREGREKEERRRGEVE
jgi:hypothetical protein